MITRLILAFYVLASSSSSLAHIELRYEERDGLFWIYQKELSFEFGMSPHKPISEDVCSETLKFTSDHWMVKACKEVDDPMCTDKRREYLAKRARKVAFGLRFKMSGVPSEDSKVDWDIAPRAKNSLDPELIESYAKSLGIDPSKSVVSHVDGRLLPRQSDYSRKVFFRPMEFGQPGGSSWFFANDIVFLTDEEEKVYFGPATESPQAIQLASKILNCELNTIPSEYVMVPFRYVVDGLRPVSGAQGSEVFGAYQKIKSEQMPTGSSDLDKALMYGFHLATMIKGETIEKIGMSTIIGKVFDTTGGKVEVKSYATAEEITDALRVVASYTQEDGYIKLTPEQGE